MSRSRRVEGWQGWFDRGWSGHRRWTVRLEEVVGFVLWIAAVILVIVGIVQLFQGQIILGIVLIIVGCLVGPGGYSIFRRR
jgi:hypothetical protein